MTGPDSFESQEERTYTEAEFQKQLDDVRNMYPVYQKWGREEVIKEAHKLWSTVEHYRADIPEQVLGRLDKFKSYCEAL